jgi:hypothetical protein
LEKVFIKYTTNVHDQTKHGLLTKNIKWWVIVYSYLFVQYNLDLIHFVHA